MDIPLIHSEPTRELWSSIVGQIYDLAGDLEYCESLPEADHDRYKRLRAYLEGRKTALEARIYEVPNVYVRHYLFGLFNRLIQ
ncbi:hypothetical protein N7475_008339 [Penicillium sp. IBT 31633x]|nr:hypothetical protein N7475_008339 [Penicillium sp. IBT 31633x]